jgi:hypothetical protein
MLAMRGQTRQPDRALKLALFDSRPRDVRER